MNELIIITPELEAGAGGVGDHTLRLLKNWPPLENLTLLVAKPHSEFQNGTRAAELGSDYAAILKQLPSGQGTLFLQYSAYGFDRFGCPRDLIRALVNWKKQAGRRLIVMFHEIWAFWPWTDKNFFLQWLHRRAIRRLLQVSDAIFTSTASQADHLRALSGARPIRVLPVGSNIEPNPNARDLRQPGWAALFGRQTSRVQALQRMEKSLTALAASRQIAKIISLGCDSDRAVADQEKELLRRLNLSDGFEQRGFGTEEQISQMLSVASFGIFGQDELSLGKSGTFMAYAIHQLNILAEFADPSKAAPVCWLVAPKELREGISGEELALRARRLWTWQQDNCSWKRIASELGDALELAGANQPRI